MKKSVLLLIGITVSFLAMSQTTDNTTPVKPKYDLSGRAADHLMIQFGSDSWTNRPDSVRTGGFSRHFNVYFMFDKPFKGNQKLSLAYGIGIGSSNMFFKNTNVDVKSTTARLPFTNTDSTNHYSKFKVVNIYAEIPVELRYYSNPENPNKSWKFAVGAKVGSLLKTYTKGKNLLNKSGNSLYGPDYKVKESNKRYFNGTMLAVTGRIGYGLLSLDAGYQITSVLKDGVGPNMNKFSIGLTVSGL